jgi:hypothetical protein
MTAIRDEAPDPRDRSNQIAGASVLILGFIGGIVGVVAVRGGVGGVRGARLAV